MTSHRSPLMALACCIGVGAGLLSAAQPASAQIANAVGQFRLSSNPNGSWSYLVGGTLLADTVKNCAGQAALRCWWNGASQPNSAIVGANQSAKSVSYATIVLPAHTITLDPEGNSSVQVVWTAPVDATILVRGSFLGIDTGEHSHSVAVLHNGAALATYTIASYQQKQPFKFRLAVAAGDTVAFASYTQGWTYLSTGLQATITQQ